MASARPAAYAPLVRMRRFALLLASIPLVAAAQEEDEVVYRESPSQEHVRIIAWGGTLIDLGAQGPSVGHLGGEASWAFESLEVGVLGEGYRLGDRGRRPWSPVVLARFVQRFETRRGLDATLGFGLGAEPEAERRVEPAPRLEPLHEAGEDDGRPGAPPAIAEPVTLPQHPDLERLERPRRLAAQVAHRRPVRTEVVEGPAPGDDPDMLLRRRLAVHDLVLLLRRRDERDGREEQGEASHAHQRSIGGRPGARHGARLAALSLWGCAMAPQPPSCSLRSASPARRRPRRARARRSRPSRASPPRRSPARPSRSVAPARCGWSRCGPPGARPARPPRSERAPSCGAIRRCSPTPSRSTPTATPSPATSPRRRPRACRSSSGEVPRPRRGAGSATSRPSSCSTRAAGWSAG